MSEEQVSEVPRRRVPAEVEQLVAEYEASGPWGSLTWIRLRRRKDSHAS